MDHRGRQRRELLTGAAAAGLGLVGATARGAAPKKEKGKEKEAEKRADIPPTEDLMREHGVLRRVLLVYGEAGHRLAGGDAAPLPVVASAAALVRRFVEGYHEKLEEDFVFPTLEKAGKRADLTKVLREQHAA